MGVIDSLKDTNKKAFETSEKFLNKSYEYYRLKAFHGIVITSSFILKAILIGSLVILGVVFLTIALGLKISVYLNSYPLGFTSIGVLYFLVALIVFLFRKQITNTIAKSLSALYSDTNENL